MVTRTKESEAVTLSPAPIPEETDQVAQSIKRDTS